MATLFDAGGNPYMGPDLTPQELKALQAYQSGQVARGPLSGEYIPRSESIGQRAAGLLSSDPVATQQQSGTRAAQAARTFYTNSAGQTGTSIPKGTGTSGVYAAAEEAAAGATKAGVARGILGTLGRTALGGNPVGAGIYAMTPNSVQDQEGEDAELAKNRVSQMSEAEANAANNWAQGVADRAVSAGMSAPAQYTRGIIPGAAEQNPQSKPEAAQKAVVDAEKQRSVVQQGALHGLQTGAVSRPELAKAVVDSDAQRAGKELTPDEHKEAVVKETSAMKTMDDNQLSKYVSYALIGGGLLAAAFDKSGKAGEAFAYSYNRSLDRQAQARLQGTKLFQEQLKTLLDYQIADRKATTGEKAQASQEKYQGGLLEQGQQKIEQGDRRIDADISLGNARNATTARGQDIRAATADSDRAARIAMADQSDAVKLRVAKIRAESAERAAKGEPMTTKDASQLVKDLDGTAATSGQTASKAGQATVAQRVRNRMRQDPTADPAAIVHDEYSKLAPTGRGKVKQFVGYGSDRDVNQYQ